MDSILGIISIKILNKSLYFLLMMLRSGRILVAKPHNINFIIYEKYDNKRVQRKRYSKYFNTILKKTLKNRKILNHKS